MYKLSSDGLSILGTLWKVTEFVTLEPIRLKYAEIWGLLKMPGAPNQMKRKVIVHIFFEIIMMLKTGAAHGNGSRPLADESTPAEASSEEPHAEEVTSPVHRPAETGAESGRRPHCRGVLPGSGRRRTARRWAWRPSTGTCPRRRCAAKRRAPVCCGALSGVPNCLAQPSKHYCHPRSCAGLAAVHRRRHYADRVVSNVDVQ